MINAEPAEVLAAFFVSLGLGSRPSDEEDWTVTKGWAPTDDPDRRIFIYDVTPPTVDIAQRGETNISPACQVRVRTDDYTEGRRQIERLLLACTNASNVIVEAWTSEDGVTTQDIQIDCINILLGPAWLMKEEEERRDHFVMTVELTLTEV